MNEVNRPCVLVLAGHDPSGGAGIHADIEAIAAQGAHALSVITALTVQDNQRVFSVHPVAPEVFEQQVKVLLHRIPIQAVKVGILGSLQHAKIVADVLQDLHRNQPGLPVVLDTVLRSGHGDALSCDDPAMALRLVLPHASVVTPNLPELQRLTATELSSAQQIQALREYTQADILVKGGHGVATEDVNNQWWDQSGLRQSWCWPRLAGEFHGSGCTLAAALAGQLANGRKLADALELAQVYTQACLTEACRIAEGQLIPRRFRTQGALR